MQWELRERNNPATVFFSFINHNPLPDSTGLLLIIDPLIFIAKVYSFRNKNHGMVAGVCQTDLIAGRGECEHSTGRLQVAAKAGSIGHSVDQPPPPQGEGWGEVIKQQANPDITIPSS
jgi:hypothetical protein